MIIKSQLVLPAMLFESFVVSNTLYDNLAMLMVNNTVEM